MWHTCLHLTNFSDGVETLVVMWKKMYYEEIKEATKLKGGGSIKMMGKG